MHMNTLADFSPQVLAYICVLVLSENLFEGHGAGSYIADGSAHNFGGACN